MPTTSKSKVTAGKYLGDDLYSWAVFIDGHPFVTGLKRAEVPYYKEQAIEIIREREQRK